jgi:small subunit ribosomal protein S6
MTTTIQKYELVAIFDPGLEDDQIREQTDKIGSLIKEHNGTMLTDEVWGRRQLAYRINKKEYGIYVVMTLEGDSSVVNDLDRQLKINESVLRHLLVKKDKYAPDFVKRRGDDEDVLGFVGAAALDADLDGDMDGRGL